MKQRTYLVHVEPKRQTWSNKPYSVGILARDRAQAIRIARLEYRQCNIDFGHAGATFRARLGDGEVRS